MDSIRERYYVSGPYKSIFTDCTQKLFQRSHKAIFGMPLAYWIFIILAIFEFCLAMAALIYSFIYINEKARSPSSAPGQEWTPVTWISAVLALPLESDSTTTCDEDRWTLIPISIAAFVAMMDSRGKARVIRISYSLDECMRENGPGKFGNLDPAMYNTMSLIPKFCHDSKFAPKLRLGKTRVLT